MRFRQLSKWFLGGLAVTLGAIQLVPVERTNPPVEVEVPASAEVRAILRRSCYDCHSHETVWPWYSRVAPVSWLIARDVREGREELNLSTWNRYTTKDQVKKMRESWEEVAEGEMPLWFYLPPHPKARLSAADLVALRAWSESVGGESQRTNAPQALATPPRVPSVLRDRS